MQNETIQGLVQQLLHQEQQWHDDPQPVWGLSTSFNSWDMRTGGLHPGEVTLLAARTSQGKTALGNQIAFGAVNQLLDQAIHADEIPGQVVIYSPEMTRPRLLIRYASAASGVPAKRIRQGKATQDERNRWRAKLTDAEYFDPFLKIRAGRSIDASDLMIDVEGLHRDRPITLLVVDYLQRLTGKGSSAYEQATYISRNVKDIANHLNIPVLAMSQVRRSDGRNNDNPPTMYELRDSGSLEQDADVIAILHVPEANDEESLSNKTKAFINIEKNRDGETGSFPLWFNKEVARFDDPVQSINGPDF